MRDNCIQDIAKNWLKHRMRFGLAFEKYLNKFLRNQSLSGVDLKEYRVDLLRKTIKVAYDSVPYYREIFKAKKLTPKDFKQADDLVLLGETNKELIKNNFNKFKNVNFKGFISKGETGGTTGSPGMFLRDLNSINYENAMLWRQYYWSGKRLNDKRVVLRGTLVCQPDRSSPPFWKENYFGHELVMSAFNINDNNAKYYIERITSYKPFDLYAYPSAAYLLAEYLNRNNKTLELSAVFTSSETLYSFQREAIEKAFNTKIFDWYGQAERVCAIGQCVLGCYHLMEDYSEVQFDRLSGNEYEIIGTTLNNYLMPLIRYKTGDVVTFDNNTLCKCGLKFKVIKSIYGRANEYLITSDGRRIGSAALSLIPRGVPNLIELQFVQKDKGEIIIRIVCANEFTSKDASLLINKAKSFISSKMDFIIEKVKLIPRTKTGKFSLVVNETN